MNYSLFYLYPMNFTVNFPMLIGVIFLIIAIIAKRFPSAKINASYGYRSKRSMKNIELWNHAQAIFPVALMRGAFGLILLGVLLWALGSSEPVKAIAGIAGMFVVIIWLSIHVEGRLKRFDSANESKQKS